MITEKNIDEAMHEYKLALAWVQAEGGNPVNSMMEFGYTYKEAVFIHDKYLRRNKMSGYCKNCDNQQCICVENNFEIIYGSVVNSFGERCFLKYIEGGQTECCFFDDPCINHKTDVFMESVYEALGWQGGTVHQVVSELKRLKEIDDKFNDATNCLGCKWSTRYDVSGHWNPKQCNYCVRNTHEFDYYEKC